MCLIEVEHSRSHRHWAFNVKFRMEMNGVGCKIIPPFD